MDCNFKIHTEILAPTVTDTLSPHVFYCCVCFCFTHFKQRFHTLENSVKCFRFCIFPTACKINSGSICECCNAPVIVIELEQPVVCTNHMAVCRGEGGSFIYIVTKNNQNNVRPAATHLKQEEQLFKLNIK